MGLGCRLAKGNGGRLSELGFSRRLLRPKVGKRG